MSYLFQGQLSNEDVILLSKQHPFVLLPAALVSVAILLIPFLVNVVLNFGPAFAYILIICVLYAPLHTFNAWRKWNKSVFLLTNRRVIVMLQKGMLRRQVAGSGLEHIHRVTHEVSGLLPSLLNYGSLSILTDDPQTAMTMPAIPQPFEIQQEILRVISGEEYEQNEELD